MRAMMSQVWAGEWYRLPETLLLTSQYDGARKACWMASPEWAEKEARAILAETEPTFDAMISHHSCASPYMFGASALADSLAEFVSGGGQ